MQLKGGLKVIQDLYNCPEPPKNWKAEYYKLKERELKEKNKKAYEERMKNENEN